MNIKKIKGYINLIRPELPFSAGICVIMGEMVALGGIPTVNKIFLGFAWGFLLASPAMILNDYFDIEVDKINAPNRPIPSGSVTPMEAVILTGLISLMGIIISMQIEGILNIMKNNII
jgi:geranylgeranylglycerol-phosphate geranylgeranyltransferase